MFYYRTEIDGALIAKNHKITDDVRFILILSLFIGDLGREPRFDNGPNSIRFFHTSGARSLRSQPLATKSGVFTV